MATSADDVWVVGLTRVPTEYFESFGIEVDGLTPGFAVGQPNHRPLEIDVLPLQGNDFIMTRAG